ncbi:secretory carrier-associated membrane protein 1-like [Nerophis lumbriciformis]|uniref:secretory carrier-associated membrane protein 1-like n=1 Tax=Nerophis lumbriciformis TaxID=546530 RepID=UPI002AE052B9|nr:secretory carrier-associated membrane protein 1-like [Nerophis lumbriciformis]
MSEYDSNTFTDAKVNNPFQDSQARQTAAGLEEYNPFTDSKNTTMAAKPAAPDVPTQPAIMKPTEEPPVYTQEAPASGAAGELLRRQEELERKAAELDRREREMQSLSASGGRKNNWPPLPDKFPVGPCFYQDITVDIPVDYQKTVKIMYYLWMVHTGVLLANLVGCLAWFCVDSSRLVDFGQSILWFLLFTPCSFACWFRPVYGAFKIDSSFRFFLFFFVYTCQVGVYVLQTVGPTGWGACGWISALTGLNKNVAVGILMILIAALFTSLLVMSLIMLKKVHAAYRTTGASFQKAQQEFATGVMSNKTVQTAAANATSRAAQGAFKEPI